MIVTKTLNMNTNATIAEGYIAIYNLTPKILQLTRESLDNGTLTLFLPGTTAAIGTIEYEEGLLYDFKKIWSSIVPKDFIYTHKYMWEENNAYSHVRASIMGASLVIPVVKQRLTLGKYQQIILIEFDNRARTRQIVLQFMGERNVHRAPETAA